MTTTLVDPRLALCDRRAILAGCIAKQRKALALICGCERCGDNDARVQMLGLIHRNTLELDDLTDAITDNPMLGA